MKYITLNTEQKIPVIGLGTWKTSAGNIYQAIRWSIKLGYTHFDCAPIYGNQSEIGLAIHDAINEDNMKRENLFITSKLWNDSHHPDDVIPSIKQTLKELQLDYIDLLLMHWPIAQKKGTNIPTSDNDMISLSQIPLEETWYKMEEAHQEGLCKAIGVSNFGQKNLALLIEKGNIIPALNQIECHPYLPQNELINYCHKNNIAVTAYSPLGSTDRNYKNDDEPSLFEDETLKEIATKNNISIAQLLLAWQINRNVIVIPKSTQEIHLQQNIASIMINLDEDDINNISEITTKYRYISGQSFAYGDYSVDKIFA